jgi:NAD-dependent deacetylase
MDTDLIKQASCLIKEAKHFVALTGAGISTASGIPDFRSGKLGLWSQHNPMEVASIFGFKYNPLAFYKWIRPLAQKMLAAAPNPAHLALTQLEQIGLLKAIITQNIDMLHSKAGTQTVLEVHGHVRQMTCMNCFREYEAAPFLEAFLADENSDIPRCPSCYGVLKPDVVLFGEQLPRTIFIKAEQMVHHADVLLVAGSSLEVHPVADFPRRVKLNGGKVILVNNAPTDFDKTADIVLNGDVVEVLPALVTRIKNSTTENSSGGS